MQAEIANRHDVTIGKVIRMPDTFHGKFRERPFTAYQLTQQAIDAHLLKGVPLPPGVTVTRSSVGTEGRGVRVVRFSEQHVQTGDGRNQPIEPGDWVATWDRMTFFRVTAVEMAARYERIADPDGMEQSLEPRSPVEAGD